MRNRMSALHWGLSFAVVVLSAGAVAPAAWAAPYAYVPNYSDINVSVINTATDATVGSPIAVKASPVGVAVSPDGSRAYVTDFSGNAVSVIDTATDTVTATVTVGNAPSGVAVSPDGSRVYVANEKGNTVSVIDTATNSVVATIPVGMSPEGVAVSPDGRRVYVVNFCGTNTSCPTSTSYPSGTNGTVSVIDTATNSVVATVSVGAGPVGAAVSPDGSRVYVANEHGNTISVIDTASNSMTTAVNVGHGPFDVAVSPDGSRLYVTNRYDNTLSVIDTATDATVGSPIAVGYKPLGVAVSPDGSRVYVVNFCGASSSCGSSTNGTVSVIDTATNAVTATVTIGVGPFSLGTFVGPGALIATNSSASGGAGSQISASVPALVNGTSCTPSDATVQQPARGSLNFGSSGAFTYTPTSATYSGPDAFTWRGVAPASCTTANAPIDPVSNTATVTLTLNPLVTGLGDVTLGENQSTSEAFSLTGSAPFARTLASTNATVLPPAGVTVSPAACGTAGHLACTLALTSAAVPGTASVTFAATDRYGDPVKKTVLVTVAAAQPGGSSGGGAFGPWGLAILAALALLIAGLRKRVSD